MSYDRDRPGELRFILFLKNCENFVDYSTIDFSLRLTPLARYERTKRASFFYRVHEESTCTVINLSTRHPAAAKQRALCLSFSRTSVRVQRSVNSRGLCGPAAARQIEQRFAPFATKSRRVPRISLSRARCSPLSSLDHYCTTLHRVNHFSFAHCRMAVSDCLIL